MTPFFTSTRFLLLGLLSLALSISSAFASPEAEAFVRDNAKRVLTTLGDDSLTRDDRRVKFQEYMNEFSDQRRIAYFVIGKYARQFSREDLARYRTAFTEYSLTSYEANFDSFRGGSIEVTSSTDTPNGKYSIVKSMVSSPEGDELEVLWRLLIRDGSFQVVDVGLNLDGNLLWLAIEQRAQLLAVLDRNQGSADALIAKLNELTAGLADDVS